MRLFSLGCSRFLLLVSIFYSIPMAQGLSAPTLHATVFEPHFVALQWTDWEVYRTNLIERKSGGSVWVQVGEVGQANSYMDRTTVPGVTYTYRIKALTSQGAFTYSNEASATTAGSALQPPNAPTLYADAVSHNAVRLRLNGIETGKTIYVLERTKLGGEWNQITSLGGLITEYLDTDLSSATHYFYRVRGQNHAGFSPYAFASVATLTDPNVPPRVPRIFASAHTDSSISLQWDHIPEANGYRIEYKASASGDWKELTNIQNATVTATLHENLSSSTEYTYRIRAYNAVGFSEYSFEWAARTYAPPPASPQLGGIPLSYNQIELRWTDVLTNCCTSPVYLGYQLQAWNGSGWVDLHFAGVDDTNHTIRALQPSTDYNYRIVALNPLASEWSTVTVRTMDPPSIPPTAAPVFYADRDSSTAIRLKWLDVELETEYHIERETFPGSGIWRQIAVTPKDSTAYLDVGLTPGTTYVYRIRAANSYGPTGYSLESAASTRPEPQIPLLNAGAISPSEITLVVQPGEGVTLYQLQRALPGGEWQVLYETNAATFRFEESGLQPSTAYTYRVGGHLDDRAPAWYYTPPVTVYTWPLSFVATGRPVASDAVELSWPALPAADHIYIRQMTNAFWGYPPIQLDGNATNLLITGLTPETAYTFQVYGNNSLGGRSTESLVTVRTLSAISGDIVIRSITPADNRATFRLRLTGSTGQKFKVQSTTDFDSWTDRTDALTVSANMEVEVPSVGVAAFYRAIKAN